MWIDEPFNRTLQRLSSPFFSVDDIFESDKLWDNVKNYGPYYYGYQIQVGTDGKPIVREFGNVKPGVLPTSEVREPFIDQIYDKEQNKLKLVAEMPGIDKQDIKVTVEGRNVHVKAEHDKRKYETTVPIQHNVDENSVKATYANGILEVTFQIVEEKPKGRQIPVQ